MAAQTVVSHLTIEGLFGHLRHEISLRPDEATILTGLNGAGKTHALHVLRALTTGDAIALGAIEFRCATLSYSTGAAVVCRRSAEDDGVALELEFLGVDQPQVSSPVRIRMPMEDELRATLPPWIRRAGGKYVNERTGEVVPPARARSMASQARGLLDPEDEAQLRSFREHLPLMPTFIVETRRLDTVRNEEDLDLRPRAAVGSRAVASPIELYLGKIQDQIDRARQRAVRTSQVADISFAERALASASKTVNEKRLRTRYNAVVSQYNDLAHNGLTIGQAPIPFPEKTNPTVRRILDPFVQDWEKRLAPLVPLNEKITLFRNLLDEKLNSSFKKTVVHARGIGIADIYGRMLDVNSLSSGEQHLLALYTRLLFDTRVGSLVLIDEPEISLHPAWQHAFIRDIEMVQQLVPMQVVIATHSPSIVNDRWELEESLAVTPPPAPDASEGGLDAIAGLEDDLEE